MTQPIWSRRWLLRHTLLLGAAALVSAPAGACSSPGRSLASSSASAPIDTPTASANGPRNKVLLAYFSRAGENYYNGGTRVLAVGNTQVVAETIASLAAVDVYRIEPTDPYADSYSATVQRNVQEEQANARPQIATSLPAVANYETVLLGSPIWNVQEPMIMRTFVEALDWTGKTIFPFVTYAVSGLGRVIANYTNLCPGAIIGEGLAVRREDVDQASSDVQAWLQRTILNV